MTKVQTGIWKNFRNLGKLCSLLSLDLLVKRRMVKVEAAVLDLCYIFVPSVNQALKMLDPIFPTMQLKYILHWTSSA